MFIILIVNILIYCYNFFNFFFIYDIFYFEEKISLKLENRID